MKVYISVNATFIEEIVGKEFLLTADQKPKDIQVPEIQNQNRDILYIYIYIYIITGWPAVLHQHVRWLWSINIFEEISFSLALVFMKGDLTWQSKLLHRSLMYMHRTGYCKGGSYKHLEPPLYSYPNNFP